MTRAGPLAAALLALFASRPALAADAPGGALARIRARGEIVWGGDIQGGEPYVFEDAKDPKKLIGFEVEIMDAVARRLGVKARFAQYNWSNLVPSLERGDFDVAMNGLEATPDRAARILFSRPYFIYAETLAVRRGADLHCLHDLKGKRVGTLNQTYAFSLLRDQPLETVLYEGVEEPYLDLVAGRLDGVLIDNIIADRYGCKLPQIRCVGDEVARGAYVIGIRRDEPELKTAIDGALEAMRADGELRAILTSWKLWDERQTGPAPETAGTAHERSFDLAQVRLFLDGALVTLALSLASFLLCVPLGLLLAVGRIYGGRAGGAAAGAYIELFRGTPVLLQLYVLYYGLAPIYNLGPVEAAVIGLGLNYASYEAEVYRGAILSIPRGQSEAAHALGLSGWQTLRHVLFPQAFRVALPAMTNDFVALLKDSSMVSVITVVELTKRMTIAAVDLHGWLLPGAACAALYFAMSFPLARLAQWMERRLTHDHRARAA